MRGRRCLLARCAPERERDSCGWLGGSLDRLPVTEPGRIGGQGRSGGTERFGGISSAEIRTDRFAVAGRPVWGSILAEFLCVSVGANAF
jgi:hypothetical protein